MKARKNKKRKTLLILIIFSILLIGGFISYKFINEKQNTNTKVITKLDTIEEYGYGLEDRDTSLYKELYNELKDVLNNNEIDYEKYAELISKLYITDLYTINNKLNLYDVGGSDFILPDIKDNYELKVKDTIYKYVEDNSDGKRNQELPEVSSFSDVKVETGEYTYNEEKYDSYMVTLSWTYVKNLGYDTNAVVTLIKKDNQLYVVSQKEQ